MLWLVFGMLLLSEAVSAKSLYVVGRTADENLGRIWAYNVEPSGTLSLQTSKTIDTRGYRPNGMTMDQANNLLFVTYEDYWYAGLVDARTLEFLDFIYMVPTHFYPGGIVYDHSSGRIYSTYKDYPELYAYLWKPESHLFLSIGTSLVKLNEQHNGGIALDEANGLVYLATVGNKVQVYRTALDLKGWSLFRTISVPYPVARVAVDSRNQLLYTCTKQFTQPFLVRYDLDQNTFSSVNVNTPNLSAGTVLSIAVDSQTGLVYALAGDSAQRGRQILIYDKNFNLLQTIAHDGYGAKILVPDTSIGFGPLNLSIDFVSGTVVDNGRHYASPGATVEFEVCLSNENIFGVTNLILSLDLPPELEFITAYGLGTANGFYDQNIHTYFYSRDTVESGASHCFHVLARVKESATEDTVITTNAGVLSQETPQESASIDLTVGYNSLGLTKRVLDDPNYISIGDLYYVDPGGVVTYELCVSNLRNTNTVSNVVLIDRLPEEVSFLDADESEGGALGFYDADTHAYTWSYTVMPPNFVECLNLYVSVNEDTAPGTVISNEVVLGSSETVTVSSIANVVTKFNALAVNVGIKNSNDYNSATHQIRRGGEITYVIDVNNTALVNAAQDVSIVSAIAVEKNAPSTLQLIDADVSDANYYYDPNGGTIHISYPSLPPGGGLHLEFTFQVSDTLIGGTVITNNVIAITYGAPASNDFVSVSVYDSSAVVQASMKVYASQLIDDNSAEALMVVLTLPSDIDLLDAEDPNDPNRQAPLIMQPGGAVAYPEQSNPIPDSDHIYFVYGTNGMVKIKGFFDRKPLLEYLQTLSEVPDSVEITVSGPLPNGKTVLGRFELPVGDNVTWTH